MKIKFYVKERVYDNKEIQKYKYVFYMKMGNVRTEISSEKYHKLLNLTKVLLNKPYYPTDNNIVVFGNNTCPYCRKTKNLLKKKKKKFIYRTFSSIDGSVKSILDDFLNIITNDYKYVPVIFHNGIFIEDGYSNLVNVI